MKKLTALLTIAILAATFITGCGKLSKPKLNEWQIELLEAEGLPTEYDELTAEQKRFINRVDEMINYLNQKYDEEFIYYGYEPAELLDSEKLYAYPKSTGIGNGKYLVTVKARNGGFEDDYHDFSVGSLAEEMVNEFLLTQFEQDEFKLFHRTNSCEIKMSEIENGDFQWKYGASNIIFIKMNEYDFDKLEKFAVNYAKFLYEHQISGTHNIHVMRDWPDYEVNQNNCGDWYDEQEYVGFYDFSFKPFTQDEVYTSSCRIEVNNKGRAYYYDRTRKDYPIDEFFAKY